MDTVSILKEHPQPWTLYLQCIWQIFLFKPYCNFKGALASIYLSGTCSDLVFSSVLCFFEINTYNYPCFQKYWVNFSFQLQSSIRRIALFLLWKRGCSHTFFPICCFFQNRRSSRMETLLSSTMIPPWFQVCINWKITC